jgi:hypothetical protein
MKPNDPNGQVPRGAHAADPGERVRHLPAAMTEPTWQDQAGALIRLSLTRTPPGDKIEES